MRRLRAGPAVILSRILEAVYRVRPSRCRSPLRAPALIRLPCCSPVGQFQFSSFMSLRIYNSLTRAVETFVPIEPGHARLYVCGMTIYDLCHVGHARMMMAFDVAQRWLKASGLRVTYVRNITDIDDKIIKRAVERNISIRALTDEMIAAMHRDIGALGVERPTHEPRATDYVPQMLSMIATLHANLPQITEVRFLVDGRQKDTLAGHADLTRVYLASDTQTAVRP